MNARAFSVIAFLVAGKLLLHLATAGLYDFHRDEIYLQICGHHLSFGTPDHAPLAPIIARLAELIFGETARAMHIMAALLSTATVVITARLTRRLGGSWTATGISVVAMLIAPVFLFYGGVYCTGTLETLCWIASADCLLSALRHDRIRNWLLLGAVLGIGFLCKYTLALCACALTLGLLFSDEKRVFSRRGPWLTLIVAMLIALPNLIWQAAHGMPALAFADSSYASLTRRFDRLSVIAAQPAILHPFTFVIALFGLRRALRSSSIERVFAVHFLVAALIVVLTPGKPYYLAPAYLPLLAIGARDVADWLKQRQLFARIAVGVVTFCGFVVALVLTLPVLPYDLILRWNFPFVSRELLQFAPWRTVAEDLAQAHRAAGASAQLGVLSDSYGTAAAVEKYGAALGLPRPISGANSYFMWGTTQSPQALLVIGYSATLLDELCAKRVAIGAVRSPFSVDNRYDFPRTIWLCAPLKQQLHAFWPRLRRYD